MGLGGWEDFFGAIWVGGEALLNQYLFWYQNLLNELGSYHNLYSISDVCLVAIYCEKVFYNALAVVWI